MPAYWQEAEDVVQEAIMRIWMARASIAELHHPEAWAMQIARNLCVDRLRRLKNTHRVMDTLQTLSQKQTVQTPEAYALKQDNMQSIHQMINSMPPKYRLVIHLRDIEEYSYQEIAEIMQISLDDVKVSLHRARKMIREQLMKTNMYESR